MGLFSFFAGRRRSGAGIQTRTDLLNHMIDARGYRRYLEIGVRNPRQNFDQVRAAEKHGVDPEPQRPISHRMTSDEFFARRKPDDPPYDLALIDGLHLADQVERDVLNCLASLAPGGTVVLHDCNPLTEDAQTDDYDGRKHWNGTVWKAWVKLRATRSDLSMCVVDIDEGCGVVRRGQQSLLAVAPAALDRLDYPFLARQRQEALNLVSIEEFLRSGA